MCCKIFLLQQWPSLKLLNHQKLLIKRILNILWIIWLFILYIFYINTLYLLVGVARDQPFHFFYGGYGFFFHWARIVFKQNRVQILFWHEKSDFFPLFLPKFLEENCRIRLSIYRIFQIMIVFSNKIWQQNLKKKLSDYSLIENKMLNWSTK